MSLAIGPARGQTGDAPGDCPPEEALRRLMFVEVSDAIDPALDHHINRCAGCQAALERLAQEESASPPLSPWPGAGRWPEVPGFEVEEELGRGGMGVVYRARQVDLDRAVALKFLPLGGPRDRVRWLREARACGRVQHPNVVELHEAREAEGWACLVLEFVAGGSLKGRLDGPLPGRVAARLVQQVAGAVAQVHRDGLLHLDLKPANVLIVEPPEVPLDRATAKVADFGLARPSDDEAASLASQAGLRGTPSYMAPEQADGRGRVGPAADVYALGAVLYELLTGRPPFLGGSQDATLRQVREQDPVPPRQLNPDIARDLETIVLKCLEKDPRRRYDSADAVAADLRRFLDGEPIAARVPGPAERAWRWARRRPAAAALASAALLAVVSVLAMGLLQIQHNRELGGALGRLRESERALRLRLYVSEIGDAWRDLQAGRAKSARERLDALAPPGSDPADDLRGFEWSHLRRRADAPPPGRRIAAHEAAASSVQYAPDGALIATGGLKDGLVKLWDARTGDPVATLRGHQGDINRVGFSPDGALLASAGDDRTVRLWDVAKRAERLVLADHPGKVYRLAFSPDGRWLASAGVGHWVLLWDTATGRQIGRLAPDDEVRALTFAPSGRTLITSHARGTLRWWDLASGLDGPAPVVVDAGPRPRNINGHILSPDGRTLAAAMADGTVTLWDADARRLIGSLQGHTQHLNSLAFSPDGRFLASGDASGEIRLWTAAGEPRGVLHLPDEALMALAFSRDGRTLASVGRSGTLHLWDWQEGSDCRVRFEHWLRLVGVCDVATPEPLLVARDHDHTQPFHLIGLPGGQEVFRSPEQGPGDPSCFALTGTWLAVHRNQKIEGGRFDIWSLQSRRKVGEVVAPPEGEVNIAPAGFSPDGGVLAILMVNNRKVELWDWRGGRKLGTLTGHTKLIRSVAFSPDGATIATGSDGAARNAILWDAARMQVRSVLDGHRDHVLTLAFSPDSRTLATGGRDGTARLWDVATGRHRAVLTGNGSPVTALAFTPDGRTLIAGDRDGTVTFWHTATLRELFRAERAHAGMIFGISFTAVDRMMVTCGQTPAGPDEALCWEAGPAAR